MTIHEDEGSDQKNKLSGWLVVSEINDNCRKVDVDGITWKIKSVTFCMKTKQLFVSPINDEDVVDDVDGLTNARSPGSEAPSVSSPKNEIPMSRPRFDSQGNGLKQFFSKKLAISRSRSVGKIASQKQPDSSRPKSPNALWASWRSQEAESTVSEETCETFSINLGDPNISIIRPIHPSVVARQYCFQVCILRQVVIF